MVGPSASSLRPCLVLLRRFCSFSLLPPPLSLSPYLFSSLPCTPRDPSPRSSAGRPVGHQKSRLSELQPEPASAWHSPFLFVARARPGRPYRPFPENVHGDSRTFLGGCVWSPRPSPSRRVLCGRGKKGYDERHRRLSLGGVSRLTFPRLD